MIIRLEPPLPFDTPKGKGFAHFMIDDGQEQHLQWVVFLDESGECWTFENPDIRLQDNLTMGRTPKTHKWRKYWETKNSDDGSK